MTIKNVSLSDWPRIQLVDSFEAVLAAKFNAEAGLMVYPRPDLKGDYDGLIQYLLEYYDLQDVDSIDIPSDFIRHCADKLSAGKQEAALQICKDIEALPDSAKKFPSFVMRLQGKHSLNRDEQALYRGMGKRLLILYRGHPEQAHNDAVQPVGVNGTCAAARVCFNYGDVGVSKVCDLHLPTGRADLILAADLD